MPSRLILGIESSCDETSAAVLRQHDAIGACGPEVQVLSNVVASQLIHSSYGGVVPELASREHLRAIVPVVREAMHIAGIQYPDLDAIAVTEGPGLAGALLVGITFAKSLAFAANKPLIAINHLEGHIHAVLMNSPFPDANPILALVVSGGHTHLYLATRTPQQTWLYRNVGKTLDDAAGEAFDKVAKLLGLPYPGGPWIDALAPHGNPDPHLFPFTQIKQKATGNIAPKLSHEQLPASAFLRETLRLPSRPLRQSPSEPTPPADAASTRFDLSFSGLKTAVRRHVELHNLHPSIAARATALRSANLSTASPRDPGSLAAALAHFDQPTLNLIASFQHAVVKNLTRQTFAAAARFGARAILATGGVAANSELRRRITTAAKERNLPVAFPTLALSTDNAAMIAAAAFPKLLTGSFAPDTLEPTPQLRLG